jgi:hypothetical protein
MKTYNVTSEMFRCDYLTENGLCVIKTSEKIAVTLYIPLLSVLLVSLLLLYPPSYIAEILSVRDTQNPLAQLCSECGRILAPFCSLSP